MEETKDKQKNLILQQNLWKVMFQLSWPAIIAMVLYGLNAVVAAAFVGRYIGESALAGVSLAYPLTQLSAGIGSLIGVGAGSLLSIAIGRRDTRQQQRLLGNVNTITIIATAVYMIFGLLFTEQLLAMTGGSGETLQLGSEYFRITVWGSFFWIYGLAANMIIRAEGKMKTAAVIMGIGLVVDILLNYLFVAILELGVAGAAWATNGGMIVYTILGWLYFGKGFSSFRTKVFAVFKDAISIRSILGLGMSSLIMNVMNVVQAIIVFNALAKYGTVFDIAFYGVVFRIFTFLLTPIFGLMRALQPVIGINYGAGQYDRVIHAYKVFTVMAMLLTLPFWAISMIAPQWLAGFMMPNEIFAAHDLLYFRIYMAILPLLSIIFMAMTFFPSIDKGKPAAIIGIVRQVVFYIPVMIFMPMLIGVSGIYWGSLGIDLIITIWVAVLVRKEFKRLRGNSTVQAPSPAVEGGI